MKYSPEAGEEAVPIDIIEKDFPPFQASADYVVTGVGSVYASLTGHDSKSAIPSNISNLRNRHCYF